jgi:two-component system chemotaxis sensor kinase CheA
MVIQNPDLDGLELENFRKSALQLMKITGELRDITMSIRMVPLATTFQKMNRVVRDMSKKLDKEVALEIIGEETEVDKNIIDHISDPIMHLVRNAIDHGIETREERVQSKKNDPPKVTLEAKNAGGDVLIIVRDNGKGLNKDKIMQRAVKNNLLKKPESEMSDKEIYSLIFLPGFSTKEQVSEFSGRGVGMDVVTRNIQEIGGVVSVESIEGSGTSIILKIPLTLAIIEGMTVKVGNSRFTIPINSIKESFKVREKDVINGLDGSEMLIVRGQCYPIVRLRDYFQVSTGLKDIEDGIILMLENDGNIVCTLVDELLGEQQAVVKALPKYIKKVRGLAGCTLLGDGDISLIIDTAGLTAL